MFSKVANIRPIVLCLFAFLALLLNGCGARPGADPPPAQEEEPAAAAEAEEPAAATEEEPAAASLDVDVDCTTIDSDIKLGMEGSITGGTADYGVNESRGFQIAIYEYNLNGGYNGQPVGCAIYDDATKAETGQENVTRMIDQDQVLGIIGAVNSGVTLGFSQQVQEAGVPLVVPISTATRITEQYPNPESFIFRISMPDVHQTDTVLAYAQKQGWTKVALLASTSGYGKAGQDDVVKEASKFDIDLVTVQNLDETDTDITAQVQAARDAEAQAIFTYALAPALANIIKSMDKVGFNVPIIGSWTLSQPQMRELAGEDLLEDFEVYMAQSYTIDQNDLARALHGKMLENFGEDPFPIAAGQTYDATRLMLKALDAAGPDRAAMRDALEQIDDFQAATSAPTQPFSPDDHEGIEAKDIFVGLIAPVEGELQVVQAQASAAEAEEPAAAAEEEEPAAVSLDVDVDCTTIDSDIKLGMEGSITGGTADYGVNESRGFQIAIYEYNLNGGYNGQPVGCAIYDDATKAETGQENVTRMIEQDQVLGIIGAVNSGVTLGFSQQVQEAGVPLVVPISTATRITEQYPNPESFIFRISMPDVHQTDAVLAYAQEQGWTKVALLASTSGYGKAGQDDVVKEAPKFDIELVTVQNLDETDTDITAQVQAARDAEAQAIFTYALAPALANIVRSMDKVGFNVPIIGSWTLAQPQMRDLAGEDLLEDFEVYMAQSYTIDQNDLARALHDKMLENFGEDPFPIAAGQTYDATRLMLKALDAAGPDRAAMRDALEQIDDFQAATTAPTQPFSPDDHEGIEAKDIFVGQLTPVEDELQVVQAQ